MHGKRAASDLRRYVHLLRRNLPQLRAQYQVRTLSVFGSHVRGTARLRSDLDLLVEFVEPPSLISFIRLEHSLSEALGVKVDLVMRDALRPAIGKKILQEAMPI